MGYDTTPMCGNPTWCLSCPPYARYGFAAMTLRTWITMDAANFRGRVFRNHQERALLQPDSFACFVVEPGAG